MAYDSEIHCPEGSIVVLPMGEGEWQFEYPRISWEVMETFHEALEYWRVGEYGVAEGMYRELLNAYPEFIDVHHHLALVLNETDRSQEAFQVWQQTVALGLRSLPETFVMGRDQLSWLFLENRPFLRACHALGLEILARGEVEEALEVFDNILAMNPGDNQGVRALVVDCAFRIGSPQDVLALCDQYPGDGMEQLMYGRVLALYQLEHLDEAAEALVWAVELLPLVAQELIKVRHRRPENLFPDRVIWGGADQAYYYWQEQGHYWKDTPGAIAFVRERLARQ